MRTGAEAVWSRIRLELARTHAHPEGSTRHGYSIILPLDAMGRIVLELYRKAPELCSVHRFWEGEGDTVGRVIHRGRHAWAFSYEVGRADDEAVPNLAEHRFGIGEYLGLREANGAEQVFRIVSVEPAPGIAHATV